MCLDHIAFKDLDLRKLDKFQSPERKINVIVCTETIEHILDDLKLMTDLNKFLNGGGRLLLTAPYNYYIAVTPE